MLCPDVVTMVGLGFTKANILRHKAIISGPVSVAYAIWHRDIKFHRSDAGKYVVFLYCLTRKHTVSHMLELGSGICQGIRLTNSATRLTLHSRLVLASRGNIICTDP